MSENTKELWLPLCIFDKDGNKLQAFDYNPMSYTLKLRKGYSVALDIDSNVLTIISIDGEKKEDEAE